VSRDRPGLLQLDGRGEEKDLHPMVREFKWELFLDFENNIFDVWYLGNVIINYSNN